MDDNESSIRTDGSMRLSTKNDSNGLSVEQVEFLTNLFRVLKGRVFYVLSKNYVDSKLPLVESAAGNEDCSREVQNYHSVLSYYLIKQRIDSHFAESNSLYLKMRKKSGKELATCHETLSKQVLLEACRKKILEHAFQLEKLALKEQKQFLNFIQTNKNSWKTQHEVNCMIREQLQKTRREDSPISKRSTKQMKRENLLRCVKCLGEIIQRLFFVFPADSNSEETKTILTNIMKVEAL